MRENTPNHATTRRGGITRRASKGVDGETCSQGHSPVRQECARIMKDGTKGLTRPICENILHGNKAVFIKLGKGERLAHIRREWSGKNRKEERRGGIAS